MKTSEFKLIIGLGNSGVEYFSTYHNAGFLFVEFIAGEKFKKKKDFEFFKTGGRIFAKPLGFMNDSGRGGVSAMKYFQIKPAEILVVHDDADLTAGNYKISFGRSAAGHRGIASIIDRLKTKDFWRLRIGIRSSSAGPEQTLSAKRSAAEKRPKAGEFVLRPIASADFKEIKSAFEKAAKDLGLLP